MVLLAEHLVALAMVNVTVWPGARVARVDGAKMEGTAPLAVLQVVS